MTSAVLDERTLRWTVSTEHGEVVTARFCLMATGPLSAAMTPDFPGLDTFAGEVYHTAHWPREPADFNGKRVAVIGTGCSGIQSIPIIAAVAAHLVVFRRTPNDSVPLMRTLAAELAPHNVRVNSVHPTNVDTPMIQNDNVRQAFRPDREHPTREEFAEAARAMNMLAIPWVESVDVANASLYLASDQALYITAVTLPADAGSTQR